jgi:hypothetical protein
MIQSTKDMIMVCPPKDLRKDPMLAVSDLILINPVRYDQSTKVMIMVYPFKDLR